MKWKYLNLSLSFLSGLLISFLISSSHAQVSTSSLDSFGSSSVPLIVSPDSELLMANQNANQELILRRLQEIEDEIYQSCAK